MYHFYSGLLFALTIGSTFLLKLICLPDHLVWFAAVSVIAGAILSSIMMIRTTGMAIGVGGLTFIYHNAPEPSLPLAGLLAFLATLLITGTGLLIAADLSTAKEKQLCDL